MIYQDIPNKNEKFLLNSDIDAIVQDVHEMTMDFEDGDLIDRIYSYDRYELVEKFIHEFDLNEFSVCEDKVDEIIEEIKEKGFENFPIPVFDEDNNSIIDGIHRLNALHKLGYTTIYVYIGIEPNDSMQAEVDCEDEDFYFEE